MNLGTFGRQSEWRAGWPVLLGGVLVMSTSWNVAGIALSTLLVPMQEDIGWSRTELSIAPFVALVQALLIPFTGLLLERFGARRVAIAGTLGMATCLALFSIVPASKPGFLTIALLTACSAAATNSFVLSRGLANWFREHLGAAIGILIAGVSLGLAVIVPLLTFAIEIWGWRGGFAAFSAVAFIIALPSAIALYKEPKILPGEMDVVKLRGDKFSHLLGQRRFYHLALACFLAALPIGGAINHFIPILNGMQIDVATIAALGTAFALSIGAGSLLNGFLYDRMRPPTVVAVTLALSAAGTALLMAIPVWGTSFGMLLAATLLLALATGAEGDYLTYFSNRIFGLANFARVVSLMSLNASAGMALGGLLFSKLFDVYGSYRPALILSIALYLVAGVLFLLISMPPKGFADAARQANS